VIWKTRVMVAFWTSDRIEAIVVDKVRSTNQSMGVTFVPAFGDRLHHTFSLNIQILTVGRQDGNRSKSNHVVISQLINTSQVPLHI
jgi:hypothetical protein